MKNHNENSADFELSFKQILTARKIAVIALLIIFYFFFICVFQKAFAHEDQKQEINYGTKGKRSPSSFTFPGHGDKYTEILKPPVSVYMRSGLVQLAVGQAVGLHSTKNNEEMLVIMEGQGKVELDGYPMLPVKGGQTAYVPPNTMHNVRNSGTVPLKYIFIVSKAIDG